jgi:peroxiredoxin
MNKIAILSTAALIFLAACQRHDHQNDENNSGTATATTAGTTGGSQSPTSEKDTFKAGKRQAPAPKTASYKDINGNMVTISHGPAVTTFPGEQQAPRELPFLIKGKLINGVGGNIILDKMGIGKYDPQYTQTVDNNENYHFIGLASEPELYQLRLPAGAIHLIVYPGDTISVESKLDDWINYKVKGSKASLQLLEMYQILERSNDKKDAIEDKIKKASGLEKSRLMAMQPSVYADADKVKHAELRGLIKRVDTSLVALMAALYLDPAEDLPLLQQLDKKFANRYPNSSFYQALREKVDVFAPTAIGMFAPEIITQTPDGKTLRLSDLKGKVILLNFWASYSDQAMKWNKSLTALYQKYKNLNFNILSYSADKKKDDWMNAIKTGDVPGIQVSDLSGFQSGSISAYAITNLPESFLINRDGRIIGKNMSIQQLDKMLGKLLH